MEVNHFLATPDTIKDLTRSLVLRFAHPPLQVLGPIILLKYDIIKHIPSLVYEHHHSEIWILTHQLHFWKYLLKTLTQDNYISSIIARKTKQSHVAFLESYGYALKHYLDAFGWPTWKWNAEKTFKSCRLRMLSTQLKGISSILGNFISFLF